VFARDDGAVLEPEVEQVAVNEEVVAGPRHAREEGVEGRRNGDGDLAEVSVGDDDDPARRGEGGGSGGRHGPKLGAVSRSGKPISRNRIA
jgi:hypothetical protein